MTAAASIVVIVKDDAHIRAFVRAVLEDAGCRVYEAENAPRGLAEVGERKPNLVILDLGLPNRDALGFVRDLRAWSKIPVLVLSAGAEDDDTTEALDAGADDYLPEPFGVVELLARARPLLDDTRSRSPGPSVECGEIRIDLSRRSVSRGDRAVVLTPNEYRLLATLIARPGCVLTYRRLLEDVWGPSSTAQTPDLRAVVGSLRRKLESDPAQPQYILAETGIGYRFQTPP